MADIPTITAGTSIENLEKLDQATKNAASSINYAAAEANLAQTALNGYGDAANQAGNFLSGLQSRMSSVSQNMKQSLSLTSDQTKQFSLLNVALMGARNQFEGLSNVDFTGVSTFSEQIEFLRDTIGDSGSAISKLAGLAEGLGQKMPDAFKSSLDAASKFVMGLTRSADNAVKLRSAYLQLAASTGMLGQVYDAAGPHLENLNSLVGQQQKMITDVAQFTGIAAGQVEKYYSQLGAVPGALNELVKGGKTGAESISMLSAVMQFATGSGRRYADVVDDLHEAFRDLKLGGEDALRFTSRMTELTNQFGNLGIEFKDMHSGLSGMAKEFKDITNAGEAAGRMTESISGIMGGYIDALTKSGMSGSHAIDTIKNMTSSLAGLKIEQKAFLSAQTGGPGGLMGGFQIEKMIRDGDIKGVMDKVQAQMKKQFGRIVTLDEAANSPQAASQLTKQTAILRSGPLGQFAKTDQDAYKMLEAFRRKDQGETREVELSPDALSSTMDKGVEIQQKTYTEISRMRGLMEASRGVANIGSVVMAEEGFAASAGAFAQSNMQDKDADARRALRDNMSQSGRRAGIGAEETKNQLNSGQIRNMTGAAASEVINDYKSFFTDLPKSIGMMASGIKRSVMGETMDSVNQQINSRSGRVNPSTEIANTTNSSLVKSEKTEEQKKNVKAEPLEVTVNSKVQVEGYCVKCRDEISGSRQMASTSPAAGK